MGAMITVDNLSVQFGGQVLFQNADLQFTSGNCYGIIGANGAGKSTFLRVLSGEVESTSGNVYIDSKARMSVLKQNQGMYDEYSVMDTVIMGNKRLYDIGKEKDAIYEKPDFTDEDGIRASELEEEFAEMAAGRPRATRAGYSTAWALTRSTTTPLWQISTAGSRSRCCLRAGAFRQTGHRAARRANEQPGFAERRVARGLPHGLRGHRARRQPRPILPQQRVYTHRRHRLRQD